LLNLRFFASPYFDHDAFVHHALLELIDSEVQIRILNRKRYHDQRL